MKIRIAVFLATACFLALAAWVVRAPTPAQADEIPEKYRETVRKGLEYLVKHQAKDGHWEGDDGKHPVAMTGLVGLALLMETNNPSDEGGFEGPSRKPKYTAQIRKGADWLMEQSNPKRGGLIYSEHASETSRYMQGHGLATLFLAGVCKGETDDARRKKLTAVLTRAVKYIVKAQSTQGGWYDTSKVEGHDFATISATVIQIQALQAAENAGIPVPGGVIEGGHEYLEAAIAKYDAGDVKGAKKGDRLADTAAVVCGFEPRPKGGSLHLKSWYKYCDTEIAVGRGIKFGSDELIHYYYAQALFNNVGGETWRAYGTATFEDLKTKQNKDGSWPTSDGIGVGQVYSTALWCIVLQLDRKSHPSRIPVEIREE